MKLAAQHFTGITDISAEEIRQLIRLAIEMKQGGGPTKPLSGKTLGMIFEKPSLRTRVTFETGMTQLGGHAIYLQPSDIGLGKREETRDVARCLARWVDGMIARTFAHSTVLELAKHSSKPVINALSDLEHPCQILADWQTIYERLGRFEGLKVSYIGDGNNVANSLMLATAKLGSHFCIACPEGYELDPGLTQIGKEQAAAAGGSVSVVRDPVEAAQDSDVLYTDVWTSMGQEQEREARLAAFQGYIIDEALVARAKESCIVLHCLPAHRGEEISDGVMEGPHSAVFDQAENRLHAQKALMAMLL
jgi:ornithine carbamoyltransferase